MSNADASMGVPKNFAGNDMFLDDFLFDDQQFMTDVLETQAYIDWGLDLTGLEHSHTEVVCHKESSPSYDSSGAINFGAGEASTSASFDFSVDAAAGEENEWNEFFYEPIFGVHDEALFEDLLWPPDFNRNDSNANEGSAVFLIPRESLAEEQNLPIPLEQISALKTLRTPDRGLRKQTGRFSGKQSLSSTLRRGNL